MKFRTLIASVPLSLWGSLSSHIKKQKEGRNSMGYYGAGTVDTSWIWIVVIVGILIYGLFFGVICQLIASSKHRLGFWWGFFFGIIGVIITACLPPLKEGDDIYRDVRDNKYENLAKITELHEKGALTDEEFESEKQKLLADNSAERLKAKDHKKIEKDASVSNNKAKKNKE